MTFYRTKISLEIGEVEFFLVCGMRENVIYSALKFNALSAVICIQLMFTLGIICFLFVKKRFISLWSTMIIVACNALLRQLYVF